MSKRTPFDIPTDSDYIKACGGINRFVKMVDKLYCCAYTGIYDVTYKGHEEEWFGE